MKKLLLTGAVLASAFTGLAQANEYPQNPVVRPLTLNDGTIQAFAAVSHLKQHDDDNETKFNINAAYGLTDDWQIGFGGITYSALKNESSGLEIALNAGFRGGFTNNAKEIGDSLGLGLSAFGKQIINDDFAVTFGAGYVHWNEDHIDNKSEFHYSIGAMANVAKHVTLSASYTFRDLKDFEQDSANVVSAGLNYAMTSDIDLGLNITYSDFEEMAGNKAFHEQAEQSASLYVAYRF